MKKILPYLMMLGTVWVAEGENFEAPAVQVGSELPGAWQKEGTVEISAEESVGGTQSLKISPESQVRHGERKFGGISFVDLQILPVAGSTETLNIGGARIGFGVDGKILVFEGGGSKSRAAQNVEYNVVNGASEAWIRVTVRIDAEKCKWDLYVDGKPAEANLTLSPTEAELTVRGLMGASTYLDDYARMEENPLFADFDKDGLPDAEERANGLNHHGDDRDGDLDGDGISNVEEMFAGSSPQAPGALSRQTGQLLYVDNLNGSDSNSGRNSYVALGNDGPKASLKAAMATAPNGATIVILKGAGIYEEGTRGVPGKQLTIKPVDPVTIK